MITLVNKNDYFLEQISEGLFMGILVTLILNITLKNGLYVRILKYEIAHFLHNSPSFFHRNKLHSLHQTLCSDFLSLQNSIGG
jgi:hypothetical protein